VPLPLRFRRPAAFLGDAAEHEQSLFDWVRSFRLKLLTVVHSDGIKFFLGDLRDAVGEETIDPTSTSASA
jgi:hypothetical protein